ncbi:uncharacterized protein LOC116936761 [Daphnia magna]|uniref:uncharacterized protein LOC116936761 n=1 Tax=Daphnia magna TaxID=35525 RepID=UPI001E1BD39A|nr:uncharacterized protein LOC116936761 [Daphnia magna]
MGRKEDDRHGKWICNYDYRSLETIAKWETVAKPQAYNDLHSHCACSIGYFALKGVTRVRRSSSRRSRSGCRDHSAKISWTDVLFLVCLILVRRRGNSQCGGGQVFCYAHQKIAITARTLCCWWRWWCYCCCRSCRIVWLVCRLRRLNAVYSRAIRIAVRHRRWRWRGVQRVVQTIDSTSYKRHVVGWIALTISRERQQQHLKRNELEN